MRFGMGAALFLTLSRVFLGPAFVIIYLFQSSLELSDRGLFWAMLGILIFSELSDIFDGIVARWTHQVSDLGKLLDPMADSMFRLSVFFTFTHGVIALPLLWVLLLFYRDCVVAAVRNLCAINGYALGARTSGKIKAIIQAISAFIMVIGYGLYVYQQTSLQFLQTLSVWTIGICALYALLSGFEYVIANKRFIKLSLKVAR